MKIIFLGNGNFGIPSFIKLFNSSNDLICLVSNTPKPAGRNKELKYPQIQETAKRLNINIINEDNLTDDKFLKKIKKLNPDLFVVVSYRILPDILLRIPKIGSINLHASKLPAYRGSSPIQRSLINGDSKIGLTTFILNTGIDKGDIIMQKTYNYNDKITYTEAHDDLSLKGSDIILESVNMIKSKNFKAQIQPEVHITYAKKIDKKEYKINFNNSAIDVHNKIRALTMPGCYCFYLKKRIKLFETYYNIDVKIDGLNTIGDFKFINNSLYIKCDTGFLTVKKVQLEGKKIINSSDFNNMNHQTNNFT